MQTVRFRRSLGKIPVLYNERRDANDVPESIHRWLCFHAGVSPGLAVAAVHGGIFTASTLVHGARPAAQCTCSDFPGILGWRVGHRVVGSDPCFARRRLLDEGT